MFISGTFPNSNGVCFYDVIRVVTSLLLQGIAPYVGLNFAVYETLKGLCVVVCDIHVTSTCVFFAVYIISYSQDTELSVPVRLCCGAVAGATAQSGKGFFSYGGKYVVFSLKTITTSSHDPSPLVTYPLDVVRRRTQMKGLLPQQFQYNSTYHAFSTILRHEGVRGMYKGMAPNLLKVAPSVAVTFVTYETAKHYLYFIGQS